MQGGPDEPSLLSAWSDEHPKAPLELLYWLEQDLLVPVEAASRLCPFRPPRPQDLQQLLQPLAPPLATWPLQQHLPRQSAAIAREHKQKHEQPFKPRWSLTVQPTYAKYQRRATDLHANARAISKQEDQLKKNAAALAKESDKWQKELDKATKGLNEFGDLQNWAEMMERDFLVLEETLRLVEGTDAVESASGGSRRR
ncbi:hypothetical protein LTR87_017264 [Friedmanniomyces endolithicus]|nr:hypothetical protein LTR87_017264 [Friedmanniomyces endolithicus]